MNYPQQKLNNKGCCQDIIYVKQVPIKFTPCSTVIFSIENLKSRNRGKTQIAQESAERWLETSSNIIKMTYRYIVQM